MPITVMAVHKSGKWLATGSTDRLVRVWDLAGGFCTHNFKGHQGIITALAFVPQKKTLKLVSASEDGEIRQWNLMDNACVELKNHMRYVVACEDR